MRTARLAADFLFLAAAQPLVGALDHPVEQLRGFLRVVGEPVVEGVAQRVLDDALIASTVASLSLVWPTNSGSRMNTDSMPAAEIITSSAVTIAARLLPRQLGIGLQAARQDDAEAGLVGAAFGVGMVLQ